MRRVVTLVCVTALMLPWAPGAGLAEPRSQLDGVRRQLQDARGGLGNIEGRRSATVADLHASQARLAALGRELDTLTADLGQAQGSLSRADATLRETTAELQANERRLDETRADLDQARTTFGNRVRASYMFGGAGATGASLLFGVDDVSEFNRAVAYVQRVMANDRQQVALIGNLERQVEATAVQLALLQERHQAERQVAQVERDRVAGLVDVQQALHDEVAAETDRHATMLAELDADRAAHVALIDSLEAESAQLEAELRRRAEAERRAEEARRVAAANAQRAARSSPGAATDAAPPPVQPAASGWRRPSDGRITSGYGMRRHPIYGTSRMHTGVDFGAPSGAPIYAATDGTVVSAGWRGGYGMAVVVDHGGGLATLYAHASRLDVSAGQRVGRGQVIAGVGSTGQSTGPHLHFEVRVNGQPRDPMPYLR